MKIEKVGQKYRVRRQIDGVKYTFTFDEKPTKKMIQDAMDNRCIVKKNGNTFRACCYSYIDVKENVLSPSTITDYKRMPGRMSDELLNKDIGLITQYDVQREINSYSKNHSPKSVRNFHGFISAVLGLFREDMTLHTHLPMNVKKTPYVPTKSDVNTILEYCRGTRYEIPIKLACYGLRRSEICALTLDDIDGNTVTVNKALVKNGRGYVIKYTTKTAASTRKIYISDELRDRIQELGLYTGPPDSLNYWLNDTLKKLGIPHFTLHKLRHYFVSRLSEEGVDDATIMALGGYETDRVMKSVYRHSLKSEEKRQEIMQKIDLI